MGGARPAAGGRIGAAPNQITALFHVVVALTCTCVRLRNHKHASFIMLYVVNTRFKIIIFIAAITVLHNAARQILT